MGKDLYFSSIVTKSLETINSDERFFEGYLTVEVKDKQGEITIVDELYKVLPVWMDRGAPISDTHSNRIIGKGINFSRSMYKSGDEEIPAIKITGKIHKNYELDNEIWSKIKSGEYKGLSFGGATKSNRTPKVMKDGSVAYQLTDLEHYEVAVCKDPAVPLALITDFNPVAKAMADHTEDRDGKMLIKCSKFGCRIDLEKAEKKEPKLTEGGKKVLQEATTVADLYKVDLRGIETFEGKVEALMDEGKSRESAEKIVGSFTKKNDAPTGHDPTQVAHSPDTPREMELEKGKDLSNTAGDTSSMYNQNGAEQRVNSKKAECPHCGKHFKHEETPHTDVPYDKYKDPDHVLTLNEKELEEYEKKKAEPNVQQGVAGGEVPPQWTGNGSPYPKGERKVIKRKKVIKTSSWKDLKNKAFDLDMQWRVIDLVKDSMDGKGDNKPKKGDAPQSHADQSEDIKNLGYELDGSHEEGETIGIGRDWDGTARGLFYKQPKQGKAPIKGKKKALINIAKKLKRETIQGKLLAGSDPEVSSKLQEHGKEIEEHHKPLKQRTREHHAQPSGDSPQVGLKQLKEQERSATNDPKDSHFGGGMQSTRNEQYESGYGHMGGMHEEQKKPVGSEEQFHRSRTSEKIPKRGKRESESDYKQRQEAYVHEKTNPQNRKKALIKLSSLFKYNRSKFKDPDYPLRLDNDNRKELAAAGATHAGGKATRMTARQLDTSEAAIRGHKNRSRNKRKKEKWMSSDDFKKPDTKETKPSKSEHWLKNDNLPSEEELDKKLGYAKKEGFTYERDHDPENHVGRETKDHARTGSAQQAQYDGTEGKSQSKEKPLKQLTDGELTEVEKLKALTEELKEGTNAANGTSPRGGDFSGTTDDGKFNVRHNGGRKTNTHGKRAEDLGNFP